MLHVHTLFNRLVINYAIYLKNINEGIYDARFDVIKPNDTRKITCLLNVVQHILIPSLTMLD